MPAVSEAALAIYGAWKGKREGTILIDGVEKTIRSPDEAVSLGLGLMAQDRRDCLIGDQSIGDNIGIASLGKIVRYGVLDVVAGRRRARDQVDTLHIKATSIDDEVRTLSGGNQQKVQIARWLAANARILIMVDPTRGVDVGARREIKRIWLGSQRERPCHPAGFDRRRRIGRCVRPGHRHEPRTIRSANFQVLNLPRKTCCGWQQMSERDLDMSNSALAVATAALRDSFFIRLKRSAALRSSMLLLVLAGVWVFFYFATTVPS